MDPRKPAVPIEIEPDENHALLQSDGTVREHYNLIYSEEDAERIRLGYCCIVCGESQYGHGECPFPENCWICGFPMREKQRERYAKEWQGHIRLGPSTTLEEELAALEELEERERSRPQIYVPKIW